MTTREKCVTLVVLSFIGKPDEQEGRFLVLKHGAGIRKKS